MKSQTNIWQVIIHHTAVSRTQNPQQFDAIRRNHTKLGWGDIAYHFLIEPDGERRMGRPLNVEGTHTIGQNHMLGICLTGHFDQEDPTKEQMDELHALLLELSEKAGRDLEIYGHRHFAAKTCPGTRFTEAMLADLPRGFFRVSPWAREAAKEFYREGIMTKWNNPRGTMSREEIATVLWRLSKL